MSYFTVQHTAYLPLSSFGIFPLTSLPEELTIKIAGYLSPREVYAFILTSPVFSHLFAVLTPAYQRLELRYEGGFHTGYTALEYFCSRGATDIVQRMLKLGNNPNESHTRDHTPLEHSINFCSAQLVALLILHGADVNKRSVHGNTPLHLAVGPSHLIQPECPQDHAAQTRRAANLPEIVNHLLRAGASLTAQNDKPHTPLQTACATEGTRPEIVSAMIAAGSNLRVTGPLVLPAAWSGGKLRWAMRGPWVDSGISLLHYAANAGNVDVLRVLLEGGLVVDQRTTQGTRAVDLGVLHSRRDVVAVLVAAGADIRISNGGGEVYAWRLLDSMQWSEVVKWLEYRGWQQMERTLPQWWNQGVRGGARRRVGQGWEFM